MGEMRLTPAADGLVRVLSWHPGHAIAVSGFYLRKSSVRAPLTGGPPFQANLRSLQAEMGAYIGQSQDYLQNSVQLESTGY